MRPFHLRMKGHGQGKPSDAGGAGRRGVLGLFGHEKSLWFFFGTIFGNMTSEPLNSNAAVTHGFDARNRLISVAASGSAPALSYAYDPDGHRVAIS
jgi:hypothetical protein